MYQTEIIRAEKPQYVVIPGRVRMKMMDFLEMIGDPCKTCSQDNLPEGSKWYCTFKGELMTEHVTAFYTDIEPSCFMRIAEELDDLRPRQISPTGQWSRLKQH